jgi:hypothetical protein
VLATVASMMSKPPRGMPKSMYLPSRTSMCSQSTPASSSIVLDLRAQHRIIRPEQPGGDFASLCDFANRVCHWM